MVGQSMNSQRRAHCPALIVGMPPTEPALITLLPPTMPLPVEPMTRLLAQDYTTQSIPFTPNEGPHPTMLPGPPPAEPAPMVLPTQDQTPQDPPTDATKSRHIRKVRRIDLKGCECGWEVSQAEIEAGDNVMRCKVQGCETVWVSHSYIIHSVN